MMRWLNRSRKSRSAWSRWRTRSATSSEYSSGKHALRPGEAEEVHHQARRGAVLQSRAPGSRSPETHVVGVAPKRTTSSSGFAEPPDARRAPAAAARAAARPGRSRTSRARRASASSMAPSLTRGSSIRRAAATRGRPPSACVDRATSVVKLFTDAYSPKNRSSTLANRNTPPPANCSSSNSPRRGGRART